ncbi:hypothetical protein [Devosia sp.]|uniref:hypothetical protein n=1 Tax=Devosia sp. TaxID=1871048 RepID=UPI00273401C2|nr:hypothetical protein [Devosia sp.]MDP2782254.1 hypothetical protein [Devosia sp.]
MEYLKDVAKCISDGIGIARADNGQLVVTDDVSTDYVAFRDGKWQLESHQLPLDEVLRDYLDRAALLAYADELLAEAHYIPHKDAAALAGKMAGLLSTLREGMAAELRAFEFEHSPATTPPSLQA